MRRQLKILLGISGGIAAYKAAPLVRSLRYRGHEVRCLLTRSAEAFVAPLTLEVLSGRAVSSSDLLVPTGTGEEAHIAAASWADVLCIAPATANTMAKLAAGIADDYLTTTALSFAGPTLLAPAMHPVMWDRAATRRVRETLVADGCELVGPVVGPLANGEVGMGRMVEIEALVAAIERAGSERKLAGRRVLVTAGPTREPVDPVRYLGNRSSGRMGFAIVEALVREGAEVELVAGPVALPTPFGVERCDVETARQMAAAVAERAPQAELIVMTAAVADFRPSETHDEKIKRSVGVPEIRLSPNPDILGSLRELAPRAVLVGFAAETSELEVHARKKLAAKGVDLLVANDVSRSDIGIGSEANEVTVFRRDGEPIFLSRRPKEEVAEALVDLLVEQLGS